MIRVPADPAQGLQIGIFSSEFAKLGIQQKCLFEPLFRLPEIAGDSRVTREVKLDEGDGGVLALGFEKNISGLIEALEAPDGISALDGPCGFVRLARVEFARDSFELFPFLQARGYRGADPESFCSGSGSRGEGCDLERGIFRHAELEVADGGG